MALGWAVKRSAPWAHQQGSTPSRCTTRCVTSLHTSCSTTLTQCQVVSNGHRSNAQEFMAGQ
jgi:hypothetical protein